MSEQPEYAPRRDPDVAFAMGADGTPAPAWVKSDVGLYRAYKQGLDQRGGPAHLPPPAPARRPKPKRGAQSGAGGASKSPGYARRAFSPSAAYGRFAAPHVQRIGSAGDSGGLFLALVLYPLFLATVRYGADGPRVWFRAKWLNKTTAGGDTQPAKPLVPNAPDGQGRQKIVGATRPAGGFGRSAA